MKTKIKIALLGLMILSLAACASPVRDLYFGEIEGTVVDADTNQPIAGAVVYANWQAIDRTLGYQAVSVGPLYVTETTTDKEGHFILPKGGPIKVVKLDELTPNAPKIGVIKNGYKPGISSPLHKVEYKWITQKHFTPADSKLSNFKLHRMTLQEMLTEDDIYTIFSVSDDVADIMNRGECWWEKLPGTIMALEQIANKSKQQKLWQYYSVTTRNKIPKNRGCKDPTAVFCRSIRTLTTDGGGSSDSASSQHNCSLPCLESAPTLDNSSITSASGGTVRVTFTLRGDIANISDVAVFLIPTDITSTAPAAGSGMLRSPTTATNSVDIAVNSGTAIGDYYPTIIISPITAPSNSRSQYYLNPYMSCTNYIYTEVNSGLIPVVTNFAVPVLQVQ